MWEQLVLPQKSRIEDGSLQGPAQEPLDDEEVEEEDVEEDGDDDEEADIVAVVQLAIVGDPPPDGGDEVAVVADHCQQQCDRLHQPVGNDGAFDDDNDDDEDDDIAFDNNDRDKNEEDRREIIFCAKADHAHCTMQLSIEIRDSKIWKSKGPVFTQFCSKF